MRFSQIFLVVMMALWGVAAAQDDALPQEAGAQQSAAQQGVAAVSRSQAGSVFEVPKVPVQAEAESAGAAQQIAREMGRRRAMDILLRRLTAEEDWIYLPQLVTGDAAPAIARHSDAGGEEDSTDFSDGALTDRFSNNYSGKSALSLDPSQLPSMEEGFSVFDEKSSARSYSAKISYRFKADTIRGMLKNAKIPYSESQTRMALVIPVLETSDGQYLWETNNPWARAWLARSLTNELTPMLLPRGDETDMDLLPVDKAMAFDQEALGQMAARYGVSQVLIAHGFLAEEDEQYRLRGRLLDGYLADTTRSAANYTVRNSSALYDSGGGYGANGQQVSNAGEEPGQALTETFYREKAGDFPALAQRAVENMTAKYASSWKAQTLVDHSVSRQININVWVDSLDEFSDIRLALEASPIVEGIEVGPMSLQGGTIRLTVVGDMKQLINDLRQRNVILWLNTAGAWNIATPGKADEMQAQMGVSENYAEETEQRNPFADQPDMGQAEEGDRNPFGDFSPPSQREQGGASELDLQSENDDN